MCNKSEQFKKIKKHPKYWVFRSGDGGIRTHVPVKAKRFRVVLVMTTSIRLQAYLIDFIRNKIYIQEVEYLKIIISYLVVLIACKV